MPDLFTHSFAGVLPAARFDSTPWAHIRIEQSANFDGPWTQIDVQTIPLDATPGVSNGINVTTSLATLPVAWFRFRFDDAIGSLSPYTAAIRSPSSGDYDGGVDRLPTIDQIGALERARTKDKNGAELGTFSENTRPTAAQVEALIGLAASELNAAIDVAIPTQYVNAARVAIALRTCMFIEVGYFPEQTESRDSAYARFARQYETAVADISLGLGPRGLMLG